MRAKFVNEDIKHLTGKSPKEMKEAWNSVVKLVPEIEEELSERGNYDSTVTINEQNHLIEITHYWTREEEDFESDFDLEAHIIIDFLKGEVRGTGSMSNDDVQYRYGGNWSYEHADTYQLYGLDLESLINSITDAIDQIAGSLEYSGAGVEEAREIVNDDDQEQCDECGEYWDSDELDDGLCPDCLENEEDDES